MGRLVASLVSFAVAASSALALPRVPLPDDALVAEGSAKLEAGDVEAALAAFRQAEKRSPTDPRPRYLRGAALATKDPEGAIRAYREALVLDPTLAGVHAELGALLLDRGRLEEAFSELRAAQRLDPALPDPWSNIARLEARRGNIEASMAAFREVERLLPIDVDVRVDHSMALRKAGRRDEAIKLAREAVALDGKSAAAQLALGFALQSAGKLAAAADAFTVATKLAPNDGSGYWALGVVERDGKRTRQAVVALRRAFELKPIATVVEDLAMALVADGQSVAAIETAATAAARHPRSIAFRLVHARVLLAEKRCSEASQAIADLPPDDASVRAIAASIRERCPASQTPKTATNRKK